jgi:hypothetical protein
MRRRAIPTPPGIALLLRVSSGHEARSGIALGAPTTPKTTTSTIPGSRIESQIVRPTSCLAHLEKTPARTKSWRGGEPSGPSL